MRHARDFHRILEGQEQALARALIGLQLENFSPSMQHLAAGHRVIGMPGDHLGERALARAVRAHDGMHFSPGHGEGQAADNLLVGDLHTQVLNAQLIHKDAGEI